MTVKISHEAFEFDSSLSESIARLPFTSMGGQVDVNLIRLLKRAVAWREGQKSGVEGDENGEREGQHSNLQGKLTMFSLSLSSQGSLVAK